MNDPQYSGFSSDKSFAYDATGPGSPSAQSFPTERPRSRPTPWDNGAGPQGFRDPWTTGLASVYGPCISQPENYLRGPQTNIGKTPSGASGDQTAMFVGSPETSNDIQNSPALVTLGTDPAQNDSTHTPSITGEESDDKDRDKWDAIRSYTLMSAHLQPDDIAPVGRAAQLDEGYYPGSVCDEDSSDFPTNMNLSEGGPETYAVELLNGSPSAVTSANVANSSESRAMTPITEGISFFSKSRQPDRNACQSSEVNRGLSWDSWKNWTPEQMLFP